MQLKTSYKDIWNVAWPVILGGVAQTAMNITDTFFLGRLGETELGASALAGLIYFVLFMIVLGFGFGMQILIARKAGEKNDDQIAEVFLHGLILQVLLSILLFSLFKFLSRPVLSSLLGEGKLLTAVFQFIDYRSWGIFFITVCLLFRSLYTGIAHTKPISWGMGMMAFINIVLNYLLVFGKYNFPEMGIRGSALASSIAEACGALFFVIYTFTNPEIKKLKLFHYSGIKMNLIYTQVKLSAPIAMQHVVSMGGWAVFFFVVEKTGERNLALSNIIRSVLFLLMTPVWGFFAAANTMTSNLIGQGKSSEVLITVKKISKMSISMAILPVCLIALFPEFTVSLFTDNRELIEGSKSPLYVICFASLLFSVSGILLGTVTGTGSTVMAMTIEITTITLYLCFLYAIAFVFHAGLAMLWSTEIVYWSLTGGLSLWFLLSNRWIAKKID